MIIACPNCGAALELPEESVGARVQCPECETLFVSRGPEEWKAQTKQRLVKALQPLTTDDAKNIDTLIRVVARLRFIEEEAQFRMLEIEDVIQSPLGLMAIIDCASSSAAALASEMSDLGSGWTVWRDVPGRRGVGLLIANSRNEAEVTNFKDIREREVWQSLSSDGIALPILLGIDFLNRDLVLNLADFNCLYITGGDTYAQNKRLDVIVRGIASCRDKSQVCIQKLDFFGTLFRVPEDLVWTSSETRFDVANKDRKRAAISFISKIEKEIERRKKLFDRAELARYDEYCSKYALPRLVFIVELEGRQLYQQSAECFNGLVNLLSSDLTRYGVHFLVVDYDPFSMEDDAIPFYLDDKGDNIGRISGWLHNPLVSLVVFGTSDAIHAGRDDGLVYKSPNGEVCKFRLAKFSD